MSSSARRRSSWSSRAPHRAEAFEACRYLIDTLKATAPIWKRETWEGGTDWSLAARPDRAGTQGRPVVGADLAVDFGTARTLVAVPGRGIVVDEPTIAAVDLAAEPSRGFWQECRWPARPLRR